MLQIGRLLKLLVVPGSHHKAGLYVVHAGGQLARLAHYLLLGQFVLAAIHLIVQLVALSVGK